MEYRYVLYARRSTDEQSASIEGQLKELMPLAEQRGLNVVKVLTESRSAKAPGRPVFDALMQMLQDGEADAILCWHLNRLTRNEKDSGDLRWNLRTGVIKEIQTPNRIYKPEDNAYITAVETAGGEQFIVDLTEASKRGTRNKLSNGGVPFKAPPGYVNDIAAKNVQIDPVLFPILKKAFQMMLTGQYSVARMHQIMSQEWGMKVHGGMKPIVRESVYTIFKSVFYTGFFRYKGDLYEGKYEPMITMDEYERLQRIVRRKSVPRPQKHAFTFSGLIRCGRCGHAVCADRKRKVLATNGEVRHYTYYLCAQGGKGCYRTSVREERIEARIQALLAEIAMPQSFFDLAREGVRLWKERHQETTETVRVQQGQSLKEVERKISDLLTLRLENLLTNEEYLSKKQEFQELRNSILANMEKANDNVERMWETVENVAEFLSYAPTAFQNGDATVKRRIAGLLMEKCELMDGALQVRMNPMLATVRATAETVHADLRKLEPLDTSSGSEQMSALIRKNAHWRTCLDDVRTALTKCGTFFPSLHKELALVAGVKSMDAIRNCPA